MGALRQLHLGLGTWTEDRSQREPQRSERAPRAQTPHSTWEIGGPDPCSHLKHQKDKQNHRSYNPIRLT